MRFFILSQKVRVFEATLYVFYGSSYIFIFLSPTFLSIYFFMFLSNANANEMQMQTK
jgi:hypothetical protein